MSELAWSFFFLKISLPYRRRKLLTSELRTRLLQHEFMSCLFLCVFFKPLIFLCTLFHPPPLCPKVAWLRVEDKGILTIHDHVITRNYRINLIHAEEKQFTLLIKNIQPSDAGGYMCQVSIYSRAYTVHVLTRVRANFFLLPSPLLLSLSSLLRHVSSTPGHNNTDQYSTNEVTSWLCGGCRATSDPRE